MQHFHTLASYVNALQQFERVVEVVIYSASPEALDLDTCQKLQLNFAAKALKQSRAAVALWHAECFDECYVIQRCILDRLFHLKDLNFNKSYKEFEDFSFYKSYKSRSKVRNDPNFSQFKGFLKPTKEDNKRFQELSKSSLEYKRPRAESVAKKLGLGFLYDQGYDWASRNVHPMFDDGERDLTLILNPSFKYECEQNIDVLHNSLFYAQLIVVEALVTLGFEWHTSVVSFLDTLSAFFKGDFPNLELYADNVVSKFAEGSVMYRIPE